MDRRKWIKQSGWAATGLFGLPALLSGSNVRIKSRDVVLTIAHITDVHMNPNKNAKDGFKKCIDQILEHKVDFILNGGDTIMAADYSGVTREEVKAQWESWDECIKNFGSLPLYSCLGNHDMWWDAPGKKDPMYGKNYAVERLGIPKRYYSFSKEGWTFFVLDGNHPGISLDEEQKQWLKSGLERLNNDESAFIMSHHPILTVTGKFYPDDQFSDAHEIALLFFENRNKVKCCVSGHMHLLDQATYNGTQYFCNGSVSGYWWGEGDEKSAGYGYYHQTPPGYAILKLYGNGVVEREYYTYRM